MGHLLFTANPSMHTDEELIKSLAQNAAVTIGKFYFDLQEAYENGDWARVQDLNHRISLLKSGLNLIDRRSIKKSLLD